MARTNKMLAAQRVLNSRLGTTWERSQLAKAKNMPRCHAGLDRLAMISDAISDDAILEIPGTRRTKKQLLRHDAQNNFLPYGRKTVFTTKGSIREIVVLSEPQMPHIAKCKVTLMARNRFGLQRRHVMDVLERLPGAKLVLVELAFDFGFKSGVDGEYVRAHALFGKSRPKNVANLHCYDSWGTRKGGKFVRSYYK